MTKHDHDLIIRGGLIVDGSGGEPYAGDVAVRDGRIAEIGAVAGSAAEEIDARGQIVTPGFIDPHTHYDGQAIWAERMAPSSSHGVTTVLFGNCGVGFAPCRPGDRDLLISAMEGVEDIPEIVMTEGLTWDWESFPEFLDALERRRHDIDIAAYIPHSALRVYVMDERGANREQATADDIARMVELVGKAMEAGAAGFATSRLSYHRRIDGEYIPSFEAGLDELLAIAREVARHGGIFQVVPELAEAEGEEKVRAGFAVLKRISKEGGLPVTFTIAQNDSVPAQLARIMDWVREANQEPGVSLRPQMFPRPVGMVIGFELSANPFMECPTYKKLAPLPIEERLAELRKPEVRARILSEEAGVPTLPLMAMARKFSQMYALGARPNYEPDPADSVASLAKRSGRTESEVAYDMLMAEEGRGMLLITMANYSRGSLDDVREQMMQPGTVLGLGDGGAHYGLICDASYPTFVLTHWARDRRQGRFSIAEVVHAMTEIPADLLGLSDRGRLEVGRRADINVIDLDALSLHKPTVKWDLPAGGKRLDQTASGYRATIVDGTIIQRDGEPTGAMPGKLIRFSRVEKAGKAREPEYAK
jgi:N-acyl-D-aspartate/D-glutamate deacylase